MAFTSKPPTRGPMRLTTSVGRWVRMNWTLLGTARVGPTSSTINPTPNRTKHQETLIEDIAWSWVTPMMSRYWRTALWTAPSSRVGPSAGSSPIRAGCHSQLLILEVALSAEEPAPESLPARMPTLLTPLARAMRYSHTTWISAVGLRAQPKPIMFRTPQGQEQPDMAIPPGMLSVVPSNRIGTFRCRRDSP